MKPNHIALHEPFFSGNEWTYVKACLDTGWVSTAGQFVGAFEQKIAEYTGAGYAIACVNGTAALHAALQLGGVQPGDEVIVPTLTFIAPINSIRYNGAAPVFMDADPYYNLDIEKTVHFIQKETIYKKGFTHNKATGKRIAALLPVHVWGNAVGLDELLTICNERNIVIVEDASESMGTRYSKGVVENRHTGTLGRLGCLSFNGNKVITAGGGGMILTNDAKLAAKARYLTTQAKNDPVQYIHDEVGYNYRLTNIQAALGVGQLEQLPEILARKRKIYLRYHRAVEKIEGLTLAPVPAYAANNHWLNMLQIDPEMYGKNRDALMDALEKNGIQSRPVWYPNHLQKPYQACQAYRIENANHLVERSLCLPSSSQLSVDDIARVLEVLNG